MLIHYLFFHLYTSKFQFNLPHLRRICVEVLCVNPAALGINVRVDSGASLDVLDLFSPYSYYDLGRHLKGQSREIKFFNFLSQYTGKFNKKFKPNIQEVNFNHIFIINRSHILKSLNKSIRVTDGLVY